MNTISAVPSMATHKHLGFVRFAAAEYDLPGDPDPLDFDDDSEDDEDDEAGPPSWDHHRPR